MGNNVRWTVCKKYTNEKELVFAPLPKHIIAVLPIFYYFFLLCFVSQLCVIYDLYDHIKDTVCTCTCI